MMIRRYQAGEEHALWNVYFRATHESNGRDYHPDLLRRWASPDQDMGEWVDRPAKDFFVGKGFRIMEFRANVIVGHPAPNFAMSKALCPDGMKCHP